jgi:hypothetical protein
MGNVRENLPKAMRNFVGPIFVNHCFTHVLLVSGCAFALIEDS